MGLAKTITTAARAGFTIERVGRLLENGVSPATVAQQLTDNDRHGQSYSVSDVIAYDKMYTQSKTKVGITAQQTNALLNDQKIADDLTETA